MLLVVLIIFTLTILALLLTPYMENPKVYALDTVLVSIAVMALVTVCASSSARIQEPSTRKEPFPESREIGSSTASFPDSIGASLVAFSKEAYADSKEAFTEESPIAVVDNNFQERLGREMGTDLTVYLTSFNSGSYPGTGTVWRNIAPVANQPLVCTATDGIAAGTFVFQDASAPRFSRNDGGFDLSPPAGVSPIPKYTLTGPPCSSLGIDGTSGFTIFVLFRQKQLEATEPVNVFQLFANNIPNLNAVKLDVRKSASAAANSVNCVFILKLSNTNDILSDTLTLTNGFDYLLLLRVGYANEKYAVSMWCKRISNANISTDEKDVAIAPQPVSDAEIFRLSNRPFLVNATNGWTVGLLALGIYKTPVIGIDTFNTHYKELFRNLDPLYQSLRSEMIAQSNLRYRCTFNTNVCTNCPTAIDWTNFQELLQASANCKNLVADFCTASPTTSNCSPCWNSNNSERFNSQDCKFYRCAVAPTRSECTLGLLSDSNLDAFRSRYCTACNLPANSYEQIVDALSKPDTLSKVESIASRVFRNRTCSYDDEDDSKKCGKPQRRLKFCEKDADKKGFLSWVVGA